jgi:hypothetical protein
MSKKLITVSLFFFLQIKQKTESQESITLPVILYGHETGPLTLKEEDIQGV